MSCVEQKEAALLSTLTSFSSDADYAEDARQGCARLGTRRQKTDWQRRRGAEDGDEEEEDNDLKAHIVKVRRERRLGARRGRDGKG